MAKLTIGSSHQSGSYEITTEFDSTLVRIDPGPGQPGAANTPEEFGRFEALARKLVNVPKSAVDERRRVES